MPMHIDEPCPEYSSSTTTSSLTMSSVSEPFRDDIHGSMSMQSTEKAIYTYDVSAGSADLQFLISVEAKAGSNMLFTFSLFMRIGRVDRCICEPIDVKLSIDYRCLDFAVIVFPHKLAIPAGSHWNLRVWLRANGVDHRLFTDDDLWLGRDIDFNAIPDASIARLMYVTPDSQTYQGMINWATVKYVLRWRFARKGVYTLSLEYEAGGVGRILFDNCPVTFECDPNIATFVIYTVPMSSRPPGASHCIRLWIRTPASISSPDNKHHLPITKINQSCVFYRLWKSDELRLGVQLDFSGLGGNSVMGIAAPGGPRIISADTHTTKGIDYRKPTRKRSIRWK